MTQYVYRFGGGMDADGAPSGKTEARNLLGGKGANLAEMANIGLPVPPGFTISTEMCTEYMNNDGAYPDSLNAEVAQGVAHIQSVTGKTFGDAADPLLVSVRSGARASMPGMMDTVLNLGLNDDTVEGLAKTSGDERFAWDSYRRFIQMYSDVVLQLDHDSFEEALEIIKEDNGFFTDTEMESEHWKALVSEYKALVEKQWGKPFPQDVNDQLWGAVSAVFGSWQADRAKVYRRLNDIPAEWGTAVNVQAMVFGNMGETSATGVAFTRNPSTGDSAYYGEWLINAQGEDVVAGIRTPQYLSKAAREEANAKPLSMEEAMPETYKELTDVFDLLERHYRDMQDIEFTVERGKLWMLQTRSGKRTAKAALKIAVDMAHDAKGILTARGGMTSHAAVVARGMGRPCVSGAGTVSINNETKVMKVGDRELKEGDMLTIDGSNGQVMAGRVDTIQPELVGDFGVLMVWADKVRRLGVRTNAETPLDCQVARDFGAEGIGLCRTEHMFFDAARITAVRQMILAPDEQGRRLALAKLLPEQRDDFRQIFEVMVGLPVTIRLLDPPLHEFLPHNQSEFEEVAKAADVGVETLKQRASELHEFNPMLGHRGCRLGVTYPEIYEMQARAIFEAACEVAEASGEAPIPEVMIPLVATARELELMKDVVNRMAREVFAEKGREIEYLVGTMIELPRAALMAGEIAEHGEFFSFGTNDLTQTTLGVSRDDAGRFLTQYVDKGIFPRDPFVSLDIEGVGQLIEIAAERGRATRPGIKLGICGEHGGDPASIAFCEKTGLDYVSASPYRVPIARLAAAQAALNRS